jgi:glycosyltransferase involved in cell wall biosynthesis
MTPFFSVCIPASGRSSTILRTLASLEKQTYDFFDIIVSVRGDKEVLNKVKDYSQRSSRLIQVHDVQDEVNYCNDWNDSIDLATGEYIAVLEGDDCYMPDYLEKTKILIDSFDCQIAVFSKTNRHAGNVSFHYSSREFYKFIYGLSTVPAPSESIFPRVIDGKTVRYDTGSYHYAPEIDLYLRLTHKLKYFIRTDNYGVYREPSTDPYNRIKWIYYRDHFYVLFRYFNIKLVPIFIKGLANVLLVYFKSIVFFVCMKK